MTKEYLEFNRKRTEVGKGEGGETMSDQVGVDRMPRSILDPVVGARLSDSESPNINGSPPFSSVKFGAGSGVEICGIAIRPARQIGS